MQTKNELVAAVSDVARRRLELQAWGAKEERAMQTAGSGGVISGSLGNNGVDNGTDNGIVANGVGGDDGATNSTATATAALGTNDVNNSTTTAANVTTNNNTTTTNNSNNDDARLLSCFVPYDPASQQLVELHAELRYHNPILTFNPRRYISKIC